MLSYPISYLLSASFIRIMKHDRFFFLKEYIQSLLNNGFAFDTIVVFDIYETTTMCKIWRHQVKSSRTFGTLFYRVFILVFGTTGSYATNRNMIHDTCQYLLVFIKPISCKFIFFMLFNTIESQLGIEQSIFQPV